MAEDTTPSKDAPAKNVDEVALDLMKFIALTTGYGKPATASAGFASGKSAKSGPEEYAEALLSLFGRCREVVKSSK